MSVVCTNGKTKAVIDSISIHFNIKKYKDGKVFDETNVFHSETHVEPFWRFNIPALEDYLHLEFTVEGGDTVTLTRPSFPHDSFCFLTDHDTYAELERNPYKPFWNTDKNHPYLVGANASGKPIKPGKEYYLANKDAWDDDYVIAVKGIDYVLNAPLITFKIMVHMEEECSKDGKRPKAASQQEDGGARGSRLRIGTDDAKEEEEEGKRRVPKDDKGPASGKKARTEGPVAAAAAEPSSSFTLRPEVLKALESFKATRKSPFTFNTTRSVEALGPLSFETNTADKPAGDGGAGAF